jgi:hypothetical protein
MPILDRIRFEYPTPLLITPFGASACAAYESFPGLASQLPNPLSGAAIQRILEFGWPIASIGANDSFTWLHDEMARDFGEHGRIDKSDCAVVHAGAVLTELGGSVNFLREQKGLGVRTVDLRTTIHGVEFDCEVTRP